MTSDEPRAAPRVTLMTAVRDGARFLAESLESAIAQTFPDWELILWDDGSTDASFDIATAFAARDPRIRLHRSEKRGLSVVRPKTMALARGRYAGWLDADDRLAPEALAHTVQVLERHPDCGMVYTDYRLIDAQGGLLGTPRKTRLSYSPHRLLVDLMVFGFRLFRRELGPLLQIAHPLVMDFALDYDFCLRVSETARIQKLAEPLYDYRRHQAQISTHRQADQREASAIAVRAALERRGLARTHELVVDAERGHFRLVPREAPSPPNTGRIFSPRSLAIAAETLAPRLSAVIPRKKVRPVARTGLLRLGYWPERPGDPSLRRLYEAALPHGIAAIPLGSDLVSLMRWVFSGRAGDLLHIHSTSALWPTEAQGAAAAHALLFRKTLDHALARGMTLFWSPGDRVGEHPWDRALAARSTRIITHSRAAAEEVSALKVSRSTEVRIVPHPSWLDVYPDISPDRARARLGIAEATTFTHVGGRETLGDPDTLTGIFSRIRAETEAQLLVAGCTVAPSPSTHCAPGPIPGHALSLYFRAADLIVVPSTRGCTEGRLALFMSMGMPVIAPAVPRVIETLAEGNYLYPPESPTGLEHAMRRAAFAREEWPSIGQRNLERVRPGTWEQAARALCAPLKRWDPRSDA